MSAGWIVATVAVVVVCLCVVVWAENAAARSRAQRRELERRLSHHLHGGER